VAHLATAGALDETNAVDGEAVPVRHFGLILDLRTWPALAERLVAAGATFLIAPTVRFKGQPGEQATMFILDPSGNAVEFKAFADDAMVFAK
jgi:extradiol dioxygenase family protein